MGELWDAMKVVGTYLACPLITGLCLWLLIQAFSA